MTMEPYSSPSDGFENWARDVSKKRDRDIAAVVTDLKRTARFGVANFRKGGTAPTDATIGTTPTIPVLLFDATNELITLTFIVPSDMNARVDFTLDLHFALIQTETNGTTADGTIDYISLDSDQGQLYTKTSTQITASTTVTTAKGLATATGYIMSFTIDADDSNNPAALTNGEMIFEFHLTNVTGVNAIHATGARINYTAQY